MKTYKRALRRLHKKRLTKKRKRYIILSSTNPVSNPQNSINFKRLIDTPTPCSCFMCGNPRKYWNEKSIQEKKYDLKFELSEYEFMRGYDGFKQKNLAN